MTHRLDLGVADVHIPSANQRKSKVASPTVDDPGADIEAADKIDYSIPKAVREEARKGLAWRKEHGRGGTEVGVATARTLVSADNVSPEKARHIARYFPRHEVDKKGKGWSPGEPGFPSNGRIAWALWGGDPGRTWSEKLVRQMDAADRRSKDVAMKNKKLADLTPAQRKALKPSQFALPELRKFPINDAAHVRNAAARLEQAKKSGAVTPAQYKKARAAIAAAAKRFGIKSDYLEKKAADEGASPVAQRMFRRRGLHMAIGLGPNGEHRFEIMHASNPERATLAGDKPVYGDKPTLIDFASIEETAKLLRDVEEKIATLTDGDEKAALQKEALKLRDELAEPRWNQIARVGTFLGHPAGPFELTPPIFEQIIANYRAVDHGQVPIDFEHASEADESSGSIPSEGAPAQGWVLDLQNRGENGLWGLTKFLQPALDYVREGKYRFFSPAIRFGAKHPESGKPIGARLTSVGLVNRPFLRGLQPLAARDTATGARIMSDIAMGNHHEFMRALRACLKMDDLSMPDEMKAKIARMRAVAAMGPHPDAMNMGVSLADYISPLRSLMSMPANATVEEIFDAVEEMIDAALERHEAEYHAMGDDDPTNPTITADERDMAVQLGETKEKMKMLTAEKDNLTSEIKTLRDNEAGLRLQLKDAESKIAEANAALDAAKAEIHALKDAEVKRQEAAIVAKVDDAFETYKDSKKLSDDDKASMLITAKADPALFDRLYPRVAGNQRHLLRDLTADRTPNGATAPHGNTTPQTQPSTAQPNGAKLSVPEMIALSDRLKRDKGMSNEAATELAYRVARGTAPMPTF